MSVPRVREYGKRLGIRLGGFWGGVLSIFDPSALTGSRRRPVLFKDPWRADYEALRSDWEAVGGDLRAAMMRFEAEVARGKEKQTKANAKAKAGRSSR